MSEDRIKEQLNAIEEKFDKIIDSGWSTVIDNAGNLYEVNEYTDEVKKNGEIISEQEHENKTKVEGEL